MSNIVIDNSRNVTSASVRVNRILTTTVISRFVPRKLGTVLTSVYKSSAWTAMKYIMTATKLI